jgi:Helix-turn-helix
MTGAKQKELEAAGWMFGDAEDFLQLTPHERALVELRLTISRAVRTQRIKSRLTQAQLAKRMKSSQARIAMIELSTRGVSIDLMLKAFLAAGGTTKVLFAAVGKRLPQARVRRAAAVRVRKRTAVPADE